MHKANNRYKGILSYIFVGGKIHEYVSSGWGGIYRFSFD